MMRLLDAVEALGVPYLHERSIRFSGGEVSRNRYLVSIDPAKIRVNARERLFVICRRLELPETAIQEVWRGLAAASCVHFGYEEWAGKETHKVYLESGDHAGNPVLLHRAWKWRGEDFVRSEYWWHRGLSSAEIRERCARYGCGDLVAGVLSRDAQYLEVTEAEAGRASFDLNLAESGLKVRDVLPGEPGIADEPLGHLAGGRHRDGRPFYTVYYGAEVRA